ncbi:MAG TPA: dihydrodipicolinate synthase family protein [Pyrinomonadaceae bacterium]|nr:dihydrodipicolinate synthase family protein [Pyrinomonadaceae bacterium]
MITRDDLKGILLPVTTPFTPDGALALDALRANLARWTTTGVIGYVLLGSTGERVHLDDREYLEVIETARAAVPKDLAFIAGAGQQSTLATIKEIERATRAGVDAVLVITPYFYRSAITQETLVSYYTAVADASPVPVLLYSMPPLTGIKIAPETVAHLSEHANIIGVKDSSNDVANFGKTVELCPSGFAVMTGNGTVFHDALKAGATGAILAVGCVVPEICVEIFRAFNAGENEYASMLQTNLTPLATAVTTRFGIGGLKAALDLAGYHGGSVRAPLRAPDESARKEIATLLEEVQRSRGLSV